MKFATLVPLRPPLRILRLASTELTEILGGTGSYIRKEFHFNSAEWFPCTATSAKFEMRLLRKQS
jgi:hypothetical protein